MKRIVMLVLVSAMMLISISGCYAGWHGGHGGGGDVGGGHDGGGGKDSGGSYNRDQG